MQIKWGAGILDARGSIGAMTVSRNRYGAYARARITPVNPQSSRQSVIRAIVADIAAQWLADLSQANRDSWDVFAANMPETNKLGEVIRLSGFNQFMRTNVAAVNAGNTAIFAAPLIFTKPGEDGTYDTEVDAGTGKITIIFDDTRPWVDEAAGLLIVEAGIPQNASRNFFDGPWRHAGVLNGSAVAAPTSPNSDLDYPFEIGDGQRVWTRAKIQREDGRTSDWFRDDSIVATA